MAIGTTPPPPWITDQGRDHAYKALTHLDDLIREVMLVEDEMGFYDTAIRTKRTLKTRSLPALQELKDRLNYITLHEEGSER